MTEREILVANTSTQKRYKLTTTAETLAELKNAMDNANITYDNMTFTEGISKTQLISDDTQLPKNVMYKGQPTNNLVILLTNTKKNIASGNSYTRKELYDIITSNSFQEQVKEVFGRNYTQVSSDDLETFISGLHYGSKEAEETENTVDTTHPTKGDYVCYGIFNMLQYFFNVGVINLSEVTTLTKEMTSWVEEESECDEEDEEEEETQPVSTSDGKITDDDIDKMMEDMDM